MDEQAYLTARATAWARYHDVIAGATLALQRGQVDAGQFMLARDAAHAELDDTLTAARVAAGYQSA